MTTTLETPRTEGRDYDYDTRNTQDRRTGLLLRHQKHPGQKDGIMTTTLETPRTEGRDYDYDTRNTQDRRTGL